MMKVKDILKHFLSRADWVNPTSTVDRVSVGDANKAVDRCLVTWMPSFAAVRACVARKVPLLVCHEPVFYCHHDDRPEVNPPARAVVARKLDYIRRHGLVILRLHDTWDRWPQIGIPWAWARFLELGTEPVACAHSGFQHRYDIKPVTLDALARRIAARCAALGEPIVQVTGDRRRKVSKIGIGTGCGCDIDEYMRVGCECSVVCDDGSCYWSGIQMAEDSGHCVIRVNHGTSEEPGMVTLTRYINEQVGLKAKHLPHGSTFRLVGGK